MELKAKKVTKKLSVYPDVCKLMKTAFPENEQFSMWFLRLSAMRKNIDFWAFFDEEQFCGISYTVQRGDYVFVLYLAVDDSVRSKGYGSHILTWIMQRTAKNIVLNVEAIDPAADNAKQREKRVDFYRKNGITDTGLSFVDGGERYSVLASNAENFNLQEYCNLLKWFSFGTYRKDISC